MPLTHCVYADFGFCHCRGYCPEDPRDGLHSKSLMLFIRASARMDQTFDVLSTTGATVTPNSRLAVEGETSCSRFKASAARCPLIVAFAICCLYRSCELGRHRCLRRTGGGLTWCRLRLAPPSIGFTAYYYHGIQASLCHDWATGRKLAGNAG
jgi:hypothetical protein